MSDLMSGKELVGKRVTLRVHEAPCAIRLDGYTPLIESVSGIIRGFAKWPAGRVGILEDDADNKICAEKRTLSSS